MKSEMNSQEDKSRRRREDFIVRIALSLEGDIDPKWRSLLEVAQQGLTGDEAAKEAMMEAVILSMADMEVSATACETELTVSQQFADPVELARKALLKAVYGDVKAIQELGRRQLENHIHELAGSNPSPLEYLSAERIAFCGQQLFHYEKLYAARMNKEPHDSLSFQKEEFYQKRVARAQRNYEAAIKTLAQVRRLQLPTMQLNIADKQINVGNGQIKAIESQVNAMVDKAAEK